MTIDEKVIAVPEQIDFMVNTECNARCKMCIQEITWKMPTRKGDPYLEGMREHFADFYELGGRKVIITGGEPTLRPSRVISTLEELRSYDALELIAMYTNGSRLLKIMDGTTVAQRLKEAGLGCVNLSLHSHDHDENNAIFALDLPRVEDISNHLRDIEMPYRYCATLQKGGIETADDVLEYLSFAQQNGAQDVYLRELFQVSNVEKQEAQPHLQYIQENFVPITPIIEELKERGMIQKTQRNEFQGRNKDEIGFTTKDGFRFYTSQLEIGKEHPDELPYLVVMPNGKLYSTWMGEEHHVSSLLSYIAGERE